MTRDISGAEPLGSMQAEFICLNHSRRRIIFRCAVAARGKPSPTGPPKLKQRPTHTRRSFALGSPAGVGSSSFWPGVRGNPSPTHRR